MGDKVYVVVNDDGEALMVRAEDNIRARIKAGNEFGYCHDESVLGLHARRVPELDDKSFTDFDCLVCGAYSWIEDISGGQMFHLMLSDENPGCIEFHMDDVDYYVPIESWINDDWTKNIDERWAVRYEAATT